MRWATAATALFAVAGALQLAGGPAWAPGLLYAACYAAGGWEPALAGLRALRERSLDVDLLMVVAALGAAAIGQVFEGALLIIIFATSGALEALATRRTADSVHSLLDLAPEQANRLRPDGTEEPVPVAGLAVGDVITVRPGELIGADGSVSPRTARSIRPASPASHCPCPRARRSSSRSTGCACCARQPGIDDSYDRSPAISAVLRPQCRRVPGARRAPSEPMGSQSS